MALELENGKVWVDPSEGYRYGFPKIYDPNKETQPLDERWLIENGMPPSYCGLGFRVWSVEDDEFPAGTTSCVEYMDYHTNSR